MGVVKKSLSCFLLAFIGCAISNATEDANPVVNIPSVGTVEKAPMDKRTALIMVDAQYDFMPGGSLPVADGNNVVPALKIYAEELKSKGGTVVATQDWHPEHHVSFKSAGRGGIWPDHCLQGSHGAQIDPSLAQEVSLDKSGTQLIFKKGYDIDHDSYSGFGGNVGGTASGESLLQALRSKHIKTLLIGGLATDYCVHETAVDALKYHFKVYLLKDASRGVNLKPGDVDHAIADIQTRDGIVVSAKNALPDTASSTDHGLKTTAGPITNPDSKSDSKPVGIPQ